MNKCTWQSLLPFAARVIKDKDYGDELNDGIKERVNITVLKLSRYSICHAKVPFGWLKVSHSKVYDTKYWFSSSKITVWFVIVYFLTYAAKNSASWQHSPARWRVFFLGGWGLDRLPSKRQFKLIAAIQCIAARIRVKWNVYSTILYINCLFFPLWAIFLKMFLKWFGSNLLTIVSKNYFTFPIYT